MNNKLSGTFQKPNKIYIYTFGDIFKLNDICRKPKATDCTMVLDLNQCGNHFQQFRAFVCLFVWSNLSQDGSDLHLYQSICSCTMFIRLACKSSKSLKCHFK